MASKALMKLLSGHSAYKSNDIHYQNNFKDTTDIFPISLLLNKVGFRKHGLPVDDLVKSDDLIAEHSLGKSGSQMIKIKPLRLTNGMSIGG